MDKGEGLDLGLSRVGKYSAVSLLLGREAIGGEPTGVAASERMVECCSSALDFE